MTQPFHDPTSPRRLRRRRTAFVLVGALIASGATVVAGQSANAAVIDPVAYYQIVSRHSGKVVDIASASTANGANVVQWTDNSGTNQ